MFKLKIGQRLVVLFLFVSLVPLALVNFYWYRSAQASLQADAVSRQALLTSSSVDKVNQYMADKVNALILHSQAGGIQAFDINASKADLSRLLKQDSDIKNVSLADSKGIEKLTVTNSGSQSTNKDISKEDSFRAATFLAGKEYISPVTFDSSQHPMITISVPLVSYDTSQTLSSLSTDESGVVRSQSAIKGLLVANIDLSSLWRTVLANNGTTKSYAYVVDYQGSLIAYPSASFLASHRDLSKTTAVSQFIDHTHQQAKPKVTTSERGISVLSAYQEVPRTGWGVIAEEPTSSIFASANHVRTMGVMIFIVVAMAVVAISYFLSRQLTRPIRRLVAGAMQISEGKLDTRVSVIRNSKDEIDTLANAFNAMAGNLEQLIQKATAESYKVGLILNNVGEGIVAVDKDGVIVVSNISAAVLAGDLPKNIIGKPQAEFFHWARQGKAFEPSLVEPGVYKDVTMTSANKRVHFIDVLVNPMANDPTGIRTIFTILDKTNERELENMKVDFVSMAAHELRTPMTAIRGYLDLIMQDEQVVLPQQTTDYIQHIQSSSTQLVGLINNLLNVSKIERGALSLKLDRVDWASSVRHSIVNHQFTSKNKDIEISFDLPPRSVFLLGDELALSEVIDNLIGNAINYTPRGGHIFIKVTETPKSVITTVSDDGIGISQSGVEKLFTKFYRAHVNGLSSGSGGTGLGLYISKSIVELHKGTIEVKSVIDQGTTFTVTLPAFDSDRYNEIIKLRPTNVSKKHGWITKNTTRRG